MFCTPDGGNPALERLRRVDVEEDVAEHIAEDIAQISDLEATRLLAVEGNVEELRRKLYMDEISDAV